MDRTANLIDHKTERNGSCVAYALDPTKDNGEAMVAAQDVLRGVKHECRVLADQWVMTDRMKELYFDWSL